MEHEPDPERISLPRERRLNMRLMAFWWDRRAARRFPSVEEFDPAELGDIWCHCFTVCRRDPWERSEFRFVGETIAAGSRLTDAEITIDKVAKDCLLDHATRKIEKVWSLGVPMIDSGAFVNEEGERAMFRSILLPLSQDQATVDHVVGGARCKLVDCD